MTTTALTDDTDCLICDASATERTCSDCGATALITDCGHRDQPRPIAAGRGDGSELHRTYCGDCAAVDHHTGL